MAGLLGDGWNDPQSAANMALAAGMIQGNFGSGLLGASNAYQQSQTGALNRQLTQTQISDMQQQIRLRDLQAQQAQRQMEWTNNLLGDMSSAPPAQGGMSGPAPAPSGSGPMGSGSMPVSGQTSFPPSTQPSGGGGNLIQQARALGIPDMAIKADIALNGGKGIAEMIYKRGTPNMQVTNGYAYDQNRLPPGYLPQLNVSQNGQASMVQIGPNGMPVMSAPQGALDTYSQYRNADEASKAGQDLVKVVGPDGAERYVTRAQAVSAAQPTRQPMPPRPSVAPQAGVNGAFVGDPSAVAAAIPGIKDPQERANVQAAFDEQARRTPGFDQGAPFPASPTTGQANTAAANKTFLEGRAKGANEYETSLNGRVQQGADMNLRLQEQLGALGKFRAGGGAETRAQLAQYAQSIPGMPDWVVKGVAGGDLSAMQEFNKLAAQTAMEQLKQSMGGAGRISQYEFKVFQNNNPNLSTDPNAIRKIFDFNTKIYGRDLQEQQAFNSFIKQGNDPAEFQNYWQQRQVQDGHTNPSMRAQNTEAPKPNLLNDLPKTAAKGARVRDTQTGDILTFNGLSWVKGK